MNKKLLFLGCSLAACVFAMAAGPFQKAVGPQKELKSLLPEVRKVAAAPMLAPADGDSLVYVESFEDADNTWTLHASSNATANYQGIYVGDKVKSMAAGGTVTPVDGAAFLVSDYDGGADVDAWAISNKYVALKAGQEYWISFFYVAPDNYGAQTINLTWANAADVASHTNVILTLGDADATSDWALAKVKFTPAADGNYYFGLNHQGPADSWYVAVDYFRVTIGAEPSIPAAIVTGNKIAMYNSAWSLDGKSAYVNKYSFAYTAMSDAFAEEYEWIVDGAVVALEDSTGAPYLNNYYTAIKFDATADVSLSAIAKNESGSDTLVTEFKANYSLKDSTSASIYNLSPTDVINDYMPLMSEYRPASHAEAFSVLADSSYATLKGVSLYIFASYLQDYADSLLVIRVLGADSLGLPDDNYEFGRKEMTFAEFVGAEGAYVETPTLKTAAFENPIGVKGKFFVVFDIPMMDTLQYVSDYNYFDVMISYRAQTAPSSPFYPATYYSVFGGEWYDYAEYSNMFYNQYYGADIADLQSLLVIAHVDFGYLEGTKEEADEPETAIPFVSADSQLSIYPNPAKDVLYIENLNSEAVATICDVTGKQLKSLSLVESNVSISDLAAGIYFISIKDAEGVHTAKFVKE